MRILKNVVSQMHRWVFWAVLSAVFWAWIFTLVTDTVPARKVTLYAQVEVCRDKALAMRLEETMPAGLKMVKVHPLSYALFDDGDLERADLYVLPASAAERLLDSFAFLDGESWSYGNRELYRAEGQIFGVKVYDAASGTGAATQYLGYDPGEDYYLFFNAKSLHLGSGDSAALRIAEALLNLD